MASCTKHEMYQAESECGHCGYEYCAECLVRPFGPLKPPLCISCALSVSGVKGAKVVPKKKERLSFAERRRQARLAPLPTDMPSLNPEPFDVGVLLTDQPAWAR